MNCWLCENQSVCEVHDPELYHEMYCEGCLYRGFHGNPTFEQEYGRKSKMITNLFDVGVDNVHEVDVDGFESTKAPEALPEPMPTEKQFAFMKRLFQERSNNEEAQILRTHLLSEHKTGKLTRKMASEAISDILLMEKDQKGTKTQQQALPGLEHGQVWISATGDFVKIALNQQGTSFYGKVWEMHDQSWIYTPGSLTNLDHLCTAEEAKEFSLQWQEEHRYCVFCMKHLSDPRSEFAGYGEKCAENNGLPWGAISA